MGLAEGCDKLVNGNAKPIKDTDNNQLCINQPKVAGLQPITDEPICVLRLFNGKEYFGYSFGAEGKSVSGQCVFQTGMVGYVESLTDPSYCGQILVFTNPIFGNYGVPDESVEDAHVSGIQAYFESSIVQPTAVIVSNYYEDYSHYLAVKSVSKWFKEHNVPAIYGVDTRSLVKELRENGVTHAKLLFPKKSGTHENRCIETNQLNPTNYSDYMDVPWCDISTELIVPKVSRKVETIYRNKDPNKQIYKPDGTPLRVLVIDLGMKNNQIRCLVKLGVEVKAVGYNYDFLSDNNYDGLFLSNGPGDPKTLTDVIKRLAAKLNDNEHCVPIFGICLGHQLLALACGGDTKPMKYGNRGYNIPVLCLEDKRCYTTSQNHGYVVIPEMLPSPWKPWFINTNDNTNEGIKHETLPFYSIQFHPESCPGPTDTVFLFDKFVQNMLQCIYQDKPVPLQTSDFVLNEIPPAPQKTLLIGSGALSIGQAGEFDYAGSQAIKAFKEEGVYVILINPNIATIQTSKGLADKIFFLPINEEFVLKVIEYENPDSICFSFGGQTALNVALAIKDELEKRNIRVLGTPISSIKLAEDRELFATEMARIGENCAQSFTASNIEESMKVCGEIGFPVIVRAGYALGGLGSGFAESKEQLRHICMKAFSCSPQVIIEKSLKGWKEIEYDVLRDAMDNVVVVCNMENVDPLGIHTGDSVVVAPSQTLSNRDYMMLREASIKIARAMKIVGECNIQFALDPFSEEYYVIELNARLSRSSALASKATGYPIAFVAAKLSLGIPLTSVENNVTNHGTACFEPSLDYCVVKVPRWDLNKFNRVDTKISSCMKSVGEVMSIGRLFEETIQQAIREVDFGFSGFTHLVDVENIEEELKNPSHLRMFVIANAFSKGYTVEDVWKMTEIDKWFLNRLKTIVDNSIYLSNNYTIHNISPNLISRSKKLGFSDKQIAKCLKTTELAVRTLRVDFGIVPYVKQVDTVAGELPALTNYLYMTYNAMEHDVGFDEQSVMTLGSGVYRIGSSVEFDWCAVGCIKTLSKMGTKTIIVNYNPETVSTDYDVADRLYLEDISLERILDIYDLENCIGVIISMGGQVPNNLALALKRQNVNILGTAPDMIDVAENRYKFSRLLDSNNVDQPLWKELSSLSEAEKFCGEVGYPVLVRPSYVLSGVAMNVVYTHSDLSSYLNLAVEVSPEHPVVISKFIDDAKEIEVDAVSMNGKIVTSVISEHVENAGVHSGDATIVIPPQDLDPETVSKIHEATSKISGALNITGPFNIQFIAKNNEIKVIECNARASRSFPFISKALGINLVEIATNAIMGNPIHGVEPTLQKGVVSVKVAQFSFSRLAGADPILGVEMASTGEVACFGKDKYEAYLKALLSTGFVLPKKNILISIGSYKEKIEFLPYAMKLHKMNYNIFATSGTTDFLQQHGVPAKYLEIVEYGDQGAQKKEYSLIKHIENNMIDLYINLPSRNRFRRPASYMTKGYISRRMAIDYCVPLITNVKCAKYFVEAISRYKNLDIYNYDYHTSHSTTVLNGQSLLLPPRISAMIKSEKNLDVLLEKCISQGFVCVCNVPVKFLNSDVSSDDRKEPRGLKCDVVAGIDIEYYSVLIDSGTAFHDTYKTLNIYPDYNVAANINSVKKCFSLLRDDKFIIIDSMNPHLSLVLYIAGLYKKRVHISTIRTKELIELIKISKENNVNVTCDIDLVDLCSKHCMNKACATVNRDININKAINSFVESDISNEDYDAIFDNICSVDSMTCLFGLDLTISSEFGAQVIERSNEFLAKIITFTEITGITLHEIEEKLYYATMRLFKLSPQQDTFIELDMGYSIFHSPTHIEPSKSTDITPYLSRVVLREKVLYLDGKMKNKDYHGINLTNASNAPYAKSNVINKFNIAQEDSTNYFFRARNRRPSYTEVSHAPHYYTLSQHQKLLHSSNLQTNVSNIPLATISPSSPLHSTPSQHWQVVQSPSLKSRDENANALINYPNDQITHQYPHDQSQHFQDQKFYQSPVTSTASPFVNSVNVQVKRRSESLDRQDDKSNIVSSSTESTSRMQQLPLPLTSPDDGILPVPTSILGFKNKKYLHSLTRTHILCASQFQHAQLHQIFALAQDVRTFIDRYVNARPLFGKIMALAFLEPSTRTECSFESAFKRLGGDVIKINSTTSSVAKGEDLFDTVRTLQQYSDLIVLRHPSEGAALSASKYCQVPLINAGDGTGEHPTQALTDAFTIREECGTINGLVIVLIGDLVNGRTVHSLVKILCNYRISLIYVSPPALSMPQDVKNYVASKGVSQIEMDRLEDAMPFADVIYVTRVQRERFSSQKAYEKYVGSYRLTSSLMLKAKPKAVVLHPFPRMDEIEREVDYDERAVYFRQMQHGLYLRMALLLGVSDAI